MRAEQERERERERISLLDLSSNERFAGFIF